MKRTLGFTRTPSHRSRRLTLTQEILLIATAFVAGGMLQLLVILRVGGILD